MQLIEPERLAQNGCVFAHGGLDAHAIDLIEKGSRFQLVHALALLALGSRAEPPFCASWVAALLFMAGSVLFCCGLYVLALTTWPVVGAVPFGGTAFIAGWVAIAVSAWKG